MVTRRRIVGLIVLLTAVSVVRADIGPPRVREDVVNIRLFAGKDYSDYIFYVCRSKGTAEQINISMDKPVVLEGEKGASLSVAAVPKDSLEKLGGEEKLLKLLPGKRIDGIAYTDVLACSRRTNGPGAHVMD